MKDHLSQHQDFDVIIVGAGPHALAGVADPSGACLYEWKKKFAAVGQTNVFWAGPRSMN